MSLIPMVVDKEPNGERSYDIFSRLLKNRIILLSGEIDDNLAAFAAAVKESEVSDGSVISGDSEIGNKIANMALSRRGSPYVYGACHSMSEIANPNQSRFDCSGLVNWAFYQSGVNIGSNSTKTLANKRSFKYFSSTAVS